MADPTTAHAADVPRQILDERPTYVPRASVERFIVPLVGRAVEAAIMDQCKSVRERGLPCAVLDVGCGMQPFRPMLEAAGFRYVGLDTQQHGDRVAIVSPIDGELPAGAKELGPFGLVLCTEVLEHVAHWRAAFENLERLTATGGRIIITCPHVYPLHEEPYDFWRPTVHVWREVPGRMGFRLVEVRKIGDAFDVLGTVLGGMSIKRSPTLWGPLAAVLAQLVRWTKWAAFLLIARTGLRRTVRLGESIYISNFVVLERT